MILFYVVNPLFTQEPFVCDGSLYLILRNEPTRQSKLFKIESNTSLSEILFTEVGSDSAGVTINSIGYRKIDNFIYGIDPINYDLYRLDNKGVGFYLDDLEELDTINSSYIAGDVSLNGQYLILVEQTKIDNIRRDVNLVFVDLADPEFGITRLMLMDADGETFISRTGDVTIHPFTGLMYGYDGVDKKLMTYNLETGIVSSENLIADPNPPRTFGALFFDEFSRLLGYGSHPDSLLQNTLYQIDINTGQAEVLESGPSARGNDGCRCIQPVGLQKDISLVKTLPCRQFSYTLHISNSTGEVLENILLVDSLDDDLRFISLDYNPFGGVFSFDSLNNTLQFSDLTLFRGIDSIIFTVYVEATTPVGLIFNQAEIRNLPLDQASIIYSDYPSTFERGDPTPLEILAPLEVNEIYHDTTICLGEELTLISHFPNAEYLWDNFEEGRTDRVTIETGGVYVLTTIINCQIITEVFQVNEESINFSLGEDKYIDLGESIMILPILQSTSPDSIYSWSGENSDICLDCPTQDFLPLENDIINLIITNEEGCVNQDSIAIFVNVDRSVFVPNAFSPNGDGINDWMFASSKIPREILYLRIYNRWGALIFENKNGITNDPTFGWNGIFKGEKVNNGVYVYDMLLIYPDGVEQQISGDITVLK